MKRAHLKKIQENKEDNFLINYIDAHTGELIKQIPCYVHEDNYLHYMTIGIPISKKDK
jgi:hypothetical protein